MSLDIRARQLPLKERYRQEPDSARMVHSVHTTFLSDDPFHACVTDGAHIWEMATHRMAGGPEDEVCSGDVLLAALAGCQEITIKMVAAAMGVVLDDLQVTVTGEMDFRGTMGVDRDVPVGYTHITCTIRVRSAGDPARLQRLLERAEQYCVVRATLVDGVSFDSNIVVETDPAV